MVLTDAQIVKAIQESLDGVDVDVLADVFSILNGVPCSYDADGLYVVELQKEDTHLAEFLENVKVKCSQTWD